MSGFPVLSLFFLGLNHPCHSMRVSVLLSFSFCLHTAAPATSIAWLRPFKPPFLNSTAVRVLFGVVNSAGWHHSRGRRNSSLGQVQAYSFSIDSCKEEGLTLFLSVLPDLVGHRDFSPCRALAVLGTGFLYMSENKSQPGKISPLLKLNPEEDVGKCFCKQTG